MIENGFRLSSPPMIMKLHTLAPHESRVFPSDFDIQKSRVRLGYCFMPYQRLWLYNGAPLVAFYDTLGIWRTYSRLEPPASSRGPKVKGD